MQGVPYIESLLCRRIMPAFAVVPRHYSTGAPRAGHALGGPRRAVGSAVLPIIRLSQFAAVAGRARGITVDSLSHLRLHSLMAAACARI